MKNIEKNALISVSDKTNLQIICKLFKENKINIISTGSTNDHIKKLGFVSKNISKITHFKEILDGRVKTLHPKIYASLLYNRNKNSHIKTFKKLNFPSIDYVIVNLYPFEKVTKKNKNIDECVEMIDIGGQALLRSAAKNYKFITTISDTCDYISLKKNIELNKGKTNLTFRYEMAKKVFSMTSNYDSTISSWFGERKKNNIKFNNFEEKKLKYGENSNQKSSYLFAENQKTIISNKIQGKEISYNNILDIDAGLNCLNEFKDPTCVIVKHNNPCGVASNKSSLSAINNAIKTDPASAFGGVLSLNRVVNDKISKLLNKKFFHVIVAKSFTQEAIKNFKNKKNLILIKSYNLPIDKKKDVRSVIGGYLIQDKNTILISKKNLRNVSNIKSNNRLRDDLIFSLKVCKHVKSNAIVLSKNNQTIGIGAGQMSRIDSTKLAILKNKKNLNVKKFVASSDAFFPFNDSIRLLIKNKCKAIVQPMGSINDKKIIEFSKENKLPLYSFKTRLFKH